MCHVEGGMMSSSEILRVRVDRATAKRVQAWAKAHGTDVSGTLRQAIERMLDADARRKRIEETREHLRESFELGLFDPPREGETWKAGGFR